MLPYKDRGAVLILVLGALALLAIVAVNVSYRSRMDVIRSVRSSENAAVRRGFLSAIEVAKAALAATDPAQQYVFRGDPWGKRREFDIDGFNVTVEIDDEAGKLSIPALVENPGEGKTALKRLFTLLKRLQPEQEELWERTEKKLGETLFSAGSQAKDILTLDQLREGGIPRAVVFDADGSSNALERYFTCFKSQKVNINTASEAVLSALDEDFDAEQVARIIAWRGNGDAGKFRVFRTPQDLEAVEGIVQTAMVDGEKKVIKNAFFKVKEKIAVGSTYYCARIEVKNGARSWQCRAYLEKPQGTAQATVWSMEEIQP